MPVLNLPLKDRKEIAEATLLFSFGLEGNEFSYRPGQYIQVTAPQMLYEDPKGNNRVFSIATSPKNKEYLMIATRLRGSGFKKTLAELPLGSLVEIEGPFGSFTLPQNASRPIILVAGGIGIAPFMSMIRYAAEEKLPHKLMLIYSNRTPESTAFLSELQELEKQNPNFKLVATITEPENSKSPWQGKIGKIDEQFLKENIGDVTLPIWYIAGPPGMVTTLREVIVKAGAAEDDVRLEEFAGY